MEWLGKLLGVGFVVLISWPVQWALAHWAGETVSYLGSLFFGIVALSLAISGLERMIARLETKSTNDANENRMG